MAALIEAGYKAIAHDDLFPKDAPDEEWLTRAGAEGWIVLTGDQRIRYRTGELEAFVLSKVIGFVVTAGNATGPDIAALIVKHAKRMQRIAFGEKPPAAFAITRDGPPKPLSLRRARRS